MGGYIFIEEDFFNILTDSLEKINKAMLEIAKGLEAAAVGCEDLNKAWRKITDYINRDNEVDIPFGETDNSEADDTSEYFENTFTYGDYSKPENDLSTFDDPYGEYAVNDCDSCPHASGDSLDVCEQCRYREMHPSGIWDGGDY